MLVLCITLVVGIWFAIGWYKILRFLAVRHHDWETVFFALDLYLLKMPKHHDNILITYLFQLALIYLFVVDLPIYLLRQCKVLPNFVPVQITIEIPEPTRVVHHSRPRP